MDDDKDKKGRGRNDSLKNQDQQEQTGPLQKLWQLTKSIMTFQEAKLKERFVLVGVDENSSQEEKGGLAKGSQNPGDKQVKGDRQSRERTHGKKKPLRVRNKDLEALKQNTKGSVELGLGEDYLKELRVDSQLKINKEYIEEIYTLPKNKDFIVREFIISLDKPVKAFAIFMEGMSSGATVIEAVLKPLMIMSRLEEKIEDSELADFIKNRILYGNQVDVVEIYRDIIDQVNYGSTAVFIDGSNKALVVETKGWDRRSIGKPETEQVIRGPHEGFNETLRSNTALIRKNIRNENLITEFFKIGVRNRSDVAIMYLGDLANPQLVEEVKRRLRSINTDYVGDSGVLEQFIEDHPFMPTPQVLATERPDRVASFLVDGKVAIIIDGNPYVLVVPTTIFSLLHSAEDYYLRLPYSNLVRFLRVVALFIAIITPGVYVAVTNFHQEMIPTELVLAIAATRQTVPFPTIVEVFAMEFAFELIREAGVRVPGLVGNTLGIVGALILGQAAVEAGIVSPILIIVVAVTGLASFSIPNYSMSFAFRGVRFVFTALAAIFGFFGITAGLYILLTSMASMKSFGVPVLAPIGPRTKAGPDIVTRGPMWSMEERPDYLEPLDRNKQPNLSRGWVKTKPTKREGEKDEEGN